MRVLFLSKLVEKIQVSKKVKQYTALLNNRDPYMRAGGIVKLTRISQKEALRAAIEALKDEHYFVRWTAADALGEMNAKEAIPVLKEVLNDKNILVREAAEEALQKINSKN